MMRVRVLAAVITSFGVLASCRHLTPEPGAPQNPAVKRIPGRTDIEANADRLLEEGRHVFRHDTFGSEDFWGGQLRLHEAIAGAKRHGVGPGLTPHQALALGLKVDFDAVPKLLAKEFPSSRLSRCSVQRL